MAVLRGPSLKQLEVIMQQLGETDELFLENLEKLRRWAETHPHISKQNREYLYPLFLRGCKHNLERAQEKLNEFFIVRTTCDTLYGNWDPQDAGTTAAMRFMEYVPLPFLTDEGYRVVIHKVHHNDVASLRDVVRMMLMLADLRMEQEHPIAGDIYVFDVKELNATYLVKLINPLLKKTLNIIQYAYPQRLKQIHVINAPGYIYNTVALFKGLMKKKMKDRFIIHTTQDTLINYIPKTILPSDYNGEAASISEMSAQWMNTLLNSKGTFQENYIKFDNIAKSMGKNGSMPEDDIYGTEGIFKTLTID